MTDMQSVKIAFLTGMQNGRSSWKITNLYITEALQKHCGEVFQVGPIRLWEVLVGKVLNGASKTLLKKRFLYYDSIYFSRRYARVAGRRLAKLSADVVIAPNCTTEIAFLETDVPVILMGGATVALLENYYPLFTNVLKRSFFEAHTLQELALKRASLILNPSEWAARSVIEDYHTDARKVHVLPYGANIHTPPPLEVIQAKKQSGRCRLLFIGTEWERKGGDIAFETLLRLEEMGIRAELIVCGCVPPRRFYHERMTVIPFLNKSDESQYKEMENLFLTSDFLLQPTRKELFGIAFSEASAFGLPVITTDTGGVSGAIENGENGFMLPRSAGGFEYAQKIAEIYRDDRRYVQMVGSSRAAFDQRLSWDAWAIALSKLITEMLERPTGCATSE